MRTVDVAVGFVGNMNNNAFSLARYLIERGIRPTLLLLDSELDHFHPSTDCFDLSYTSYTRQVSWGTPHRFLSTSDNVVRRDLEPYDILIGCGLAPAYCERAGRPLDIFIPFGSDVTLFPRYRLASPHALHAVIASAYFQRRGLRRCRILHTTLWPPTYEEFFAKAMPTTERWFEPVPLLHGPTYSPTNVVEMAARTHWAHEFQKIREQHELVAFSTNRHVFQDSSDKANEKGTECLLRGWAEFRKRNPHVTAMLVTIEYGSDVYQSKMLVEQLGIKDSVAWFPKMCRKDLMVGLSMADLAFGQFGTSWISSSSIFEALVLGKPIVAYRDDGSYASKYKSLYPILNANDPVAIAERLEECLTDPDACKRVGELGRAWYEEVVVNPALSKYLSYFSARAAELG